jgi:hypothetical protein
MVCEVLAAQPIDIDLDLAITSLDARFASPTMPTAMATTMPMTMPMTRQASADGLDYPGSNSAMCPSEQHWH